MSSNGGAPIPVAILCGGRGTRLGREAESTPKALVEIGGRPIIEEVIGIYSSQGFTRFLLLTGYKGEELSEWAASTAVPAEVSIECLDTGLDTETGGRVLRASEHLGDTAFALTYADGVADLDLDSELSFHRKHGRLATMAVVRPELQFGVANIDSDGAVAGFEEKPVLDGWANGGFFVFEPGVADFLEPDSVLEREPLERLSADGNLMAYRHAGFWRCMDTWKDKQLLDDLIADGKRPWTAGAGAESGV